MVVQYLTPLVNEQLLLIYSAASDRVGIYGLIRQEPKTKVIKSIYVHSKLLIVDDKMVCIGSSNMDNLSFNLSSELNMNIYNAQVATETKERLVREHLEYFTPDMRKDFKPIFNAFKEVRNHNILISRLQHPIMRVFQNLELQLGDWYFLYQHRDMNLFQSW
jgi:phosphatidylserine/phosphatidylglycerophosphate/cardiolipin synthase-like enzyme